MTTTKNYSTIMKEKYKKIIKEFLIQENIKIHGNDLGGYYYSLEDYIFNKFKVSTIVFNKDCRYDSFCDSHRPYLSEKVYSENRRHEVFNRNQNIISYIDFTRIFNNFIKEHE